MAHTENSVVVYVDDEEKESVRQQAKKQGKSMSRYLLDLHLNQTVGKTTDAVKILYDRYIKNSPGINTWASVVASVCIRGENSETFHQAIKLHDVDVPKQPI